MDKVQYKSRSSDCVSSWSGIQLTDIGTEPTTNRMDH